MKKLAYIRVIQYFFYEANEIVVGMNCGIIGANGSGKSSLLDAVQIVMLGANESRGSKGVLFNAQADEANHASRTIRSYCLGQYGETPDMRVRDRATTYITLVWHDTATQEIISTGVCIEASSERERPDILGRYIIPVDLTLGDHLEQIDGEQQPRQWGGFRQMLSQRAHGVEVLFHDSERFVSAMLFQLRGVRGIPDQDAFRRAFRFGLGLKYDKSVDAIVRQHVLEARPTNIKRFKDVLQTFQEMAALVRSVEAKLEEAEVIQAVFADAQRRNSQAVSLAALACAAERDLANAAVKAAEAAEKEAITALQAATTLSDTLTRRVEAAEERARASAADRDKHASHADIGLLRENLAGTQKRRGDQRTRLDRSIHVIGKAIAVQIPGKLIADHADAIELARAAIAAMLTSDDIGSRADIEATVRTAVRAAKLLSNEVFDQMRRVSRAQNEAETERASVRENQERIAKGKPPLDGSAAALRRAFARAGIDATPVCDLVRIAAPEWQPAIESYLGSTNMQALLVEAADERAAFRLARKADIFEAKVVMPSKFTHRTSPKDGTVAELICGNNTAAVNYLRAKFGDTMQADSEEQCFRYRFALTKDGMRISDGELVRKKPIHPAFFKIGPTSESTRSAVASRASQLEEEVKALAARYATLKQLLNTLAPFVSEDGEKVDEILETFDQLIAERSAEADLQRRLHAADTMEYRQYVKAAEEANAAVTLARQEQLDAVRTVGAAKTMCQQKTAETKAQQEQAGAQTTRADAARAVAGFDADYAADEWEKLRAQQGLSLKQIVAHCNQCSQRAEAGSRQKVSNAMPKLIALLVRHNEYMPTDKQDDWHAAHAWLDDRIATLKNTGLRENKERMEDALKTAKSTFRNDVAVVLNERLECLSDTMNRLNEALRLAPLFSNNECYQFRAQPRSAFSALQRFIKDVALNGPNDDLFHASGELPEAFEELMHEKTVAGAAVVKSPLDDYREFYDFDIEILRQNASTGATKHIGWLSKRVGPGSGGEHRAPLYVIAGAALASAYRLERNDDTGIRLLVIDEAFIKMDLGNTIATMRYFEELGLQVLLASTGDALGNLTAFLDRYYDIMRIAECNAILLAGHEVYCETNALFRADLPEFHPELVEAEVQQQSQAKIASTTDAMR